jgi:hypothetical protein
MSCLSATAQYLVVAHETPFNSAGVPSAPSSATIYARTELCATSGLWESQFFQGGGIAGSIEPANFCAISADGAVVALLHQNSALGNTLLFLVRSGTTWSLAQTISLNTLSLGAFSNGVVALSGNGTYAAVSGLFAGVSTSVITFFARRGNQWVQESQLTTVGNAESQPIAMSSDGTMVYLANIGASTFSLYCRTPDNVWTLYETVSVPNMFLGQNVACSADGSIVAVGQPFANGGAGQVTVFYPTVSFIPATTSVGGTLCVEGSSTSGPLSLIGNLHVQGTITTGTTVTACSTTPSDEQIKTDIQPLSANDADRVLHDLQPVNFSWTDDTLRVHEPQQQAGFIAQDLEKIFADWVLTAPDPSSDNQQHDDLVTDNVKMVELPHEMLAYLVRKIQRLYEKDAEQQERIDKLVH